MEEEEEERVGGEKRRRRLADGRGEAGGGRGRSRLGG